MKNTWFTSRLTMFAAVALASAVLFGCGDDDDNGSSDTGTTESVASTEQATAEPASLPKPISAKGAAQVEIEDRLLNEFEIPGGPDWMVAAFDSLWVKLDSGEVVRVDPEASEMVAEIGEIKGQGHLCQGIGATEQAIWSCPPSDPTTVTRIDPASNSVTASIRIDKLPDQGRLVGAAGRLWLLTDSGEKLTAIDPATNKPAATIPLGGRCTDLAADRATIYAMCPFEDSVLVVDATAGEVRDEIGLAGAANASVSTDLWVAFEGGVAQVDTKTLEVKAVYELYPRYGGTTFATPDAVWVREEGGPFLTRIDPKRQRIVETIAAPKLPSGGDVVVIGDSVWATAFDDATLVELSAD
jgi:hypothetical protein